MMLSPYKQAISVLYKFQAQSLVNKLQILLIRNNVIKKHLHPVIYEMDL